MQNPMKRFFIIAKAFTYFAFFAITLTSCSITYNAKKTYLASKKDKPYDVIIVPGAPYQYGSVTNILKMRVFWAKHLYDSGYAKNIIFSGSSVYTPYVEGIVMKLMADSLGIPSDHTFAETRAEHSTENIYYSWKMAKSMGFTKIAIATDPYQLNMLKRFTKKYCADVRSLPVIFGKMNFRSKTLPNIDSSSAYVEDFVSITKRETFWQRLSGSRGKRILEEIEAERLLSETANIKKRKEPDVN
jgi:uncharacterized SAM-binding protein YcdF (DUF218 family)